MSDFNQAIPIILQHEGGLVNDPNDPGGITNFGISLRYLQSLVQQEPQLLSVYDVDHQGVINALDIRDLPEADAIQIYKTQWWDKYNYGEINDQSLATKIFDLAVNMGGITANKLLQQACNILSGNNCVEVDGILGVMSLAVINKLNPVATLQTLRQQAIQYYQNLVANNPSLSKFLNGWLNRVEEP